MAGDAPHRRQVGETAWALVCQTEGSLGITCFSRKGGGEGYLNNARSALSPRWLEVTAGSPGPAREKGVRNR
jgi:hypothetical protein